MPTEIIKFKFNTAVHFGKKRISDGEMTISAGTLFSALYIESLQMKKDTQWLLNDLIISDTFPYIADLFYLPKPLLRVENKNESNPKVFKKLKYVPVYNFSDYVNGQLTAEDAKYLADDFHIGEYSLQTKVALQQQEIDPNADSEPYSIGTFTFEEDAGIYFIAKGTNETLNNLKDVLQSLQYSGVGGKRSAGYGRFTFEIATNDILVQLLQQKGQHNVLLSTAMAKERELERSCEGARYIIEKNQVLYNHQITNVN